MPDIKFIGAGAGFAFLVSLVSGIMGRVGFFTLIFRALAGAVVFGLLVFGIYMVLLKVIPELFESARTEEETGEAAAESGGNVDITLGENESESPEYGRESTEAPVGEEDAGTGSLDFGTEDEDSLGEDEFVEEVDGGEAGEEPAEESEWRSTEEPAEGAGESEEPAAAREESGTGSEDTFEEAGDVDTLPDLEDFAESFDGVAASQEGEDGNVSRGGSSSSSVDVMGDQQDPETVAKAVRKKKKKDQEG